MFRNQMLKFVLILSANEYQLSRHNCDDMIRKLKSELTESLESQEQARNMLSQTQVTQ